ncbi:MAG: nuclear transport factor 2 family protein [Elusimicrobiales bacterium]|nr:nuclear transport factor 2 family protein [Elusimicrobiales bacterium]
MPCNENEELVRELWKAFNELRWEDSKKLLHKTFVNEYPQSRERFRGAENFVGMNKAYPGRFKIEVLRTRPCGDGVIAETFIAPEGGTPVFAISFYEFRDGKISKAVEYWGDVYAAPDWRARWAERF